MRILIHGQQAFGKAVLERLLDGPDDIAAVFCPPDIENRPIDPMKALACEAALPVHQLKSWKTGEALALISSFKADLCVMAYVTQLIPQACLDVPALGSIQYHPSLLPKHRGPSSINWPIIQGETKTGLSIFWPDEGLDTGPVALQKEIEIGPDDTVGSIYFDKLFPLGVDAMIEATEMVRDRTAPRIEQDESEATYESWCREENAEIDWSQPARQLHCLIRGTDPQPGAWTTVGGNKLKLYGSRIADVEGEAGTITNVSKAGITVAAGDGSILVTKVRAHDDRAKVDAGEYAEHAGLGTATRLGD
ncbi:MAG: methionyl-tRNA formyltransferase [Alphaproteobacteria bacterium]|nr:methionyl-tRNA formyltransferase [Alphaproteobacteria bacterium]